MKRVEDKVELEDIKKVAQKIGRAFKPEKIILFGSYAWGEPNADSDVDLFVIKETDNTREEAIKLRMAAYPRQFAMDMLVYTPKQVIKRLKGNDFLLKDIMARGKVLYE